MYVKISDDAEILAGNEYFFDKDINVLVGGNGSGKSTLIKAIILSQLDNWELSSDYKLPKSKITVENSEKDIGYYVAENSNKSKMSHFSDDMFSQIQDMKSSSGQATFNQVLRAINHKLVILDEPDQSLDMCNSIVLKEVLPRVVLKNGSKIIIVVHSAYLLDGLGEFSNVKIIDVRTATEITAKEYLQEQFRKAQIMLGGK